MYNNLKFNIYFYSSVILAVWFALTSWVWVYYANLIYSLPFGLLSILFLYIGKKGDTDSGRYKVPAIILTIGAVISIVTLIFLLILG
jgi:hypothetical protein